MANERDGWTTWFRWLVVAGGPWWFRWPVRLLLVVGLVALAMVPYHHEVGGTCRVAPAAQRSIRSQLDDEILQVHVKEGDCVEPGSPIATLATRKDRAAVAACQAALDKAQAQLDLLRAGPRAEDIAIAEQKVDLWKAQSEYAEKQLKRITELQKQDTASLRELDEAQKTHASDQSELLGARENLQKLLAGYRPELIREAEADVRRNQAELAYHQEMVGLGHITSPIAGRIITMNIGERPGQGVKAGDLVAIVHDTSPVRVEIVGEEPTAAVVAEGMPVNVRLWGTHGRLLTGRVRGAARATSELSAFHVERVRTDREEQRKEEADHETDQRIWVYVDLDSCDEHLVPGMTGYARIVVEEGTVWEALARPVLRFFRVEVWSWLP